MFSGAESESSGNAGKINLDLGRLRVSGGAAINSSTSGSGSGGDITVRATNSISVSDGASIFSVAFGADGEGDDAKAGPAGNLSFSSFNMAVTDGARITSRTDGDGDAGNIGIHVGTLTLARGGQIFSSVGTLNTDGSVDATGGDGKAGNLNVTAAESVTLAGRDAQGFTSGLFSNALKGSGSAGDVSVSAPALELSDAAYILSTAGSESSGNAGKIDLDVGRLSVSDSAKINSSTSRNGQGGAITIRAADSISVSRILLKQTKARILSVR